MSFTVSPFWASIFSEIRHSLVLPFKDQETSRIKLLWLWVVKHFQGVRWIIPYSDSFIWLVVSTHLKNISQNGNLPQIGVKIKNMRNHHLVYAFYNYSFFIPQQTNDHNKRFLRQRKTPLGFKGPRSCNRALFQRFTMMGTPWYASHDGNLAFPTHHLNKRIAQKIPFVPGWQTNYHHQYHQHQKSLRNSALMSHCNGTNRFACRLNQRVRLFWPCSSSQGQMLEAVEHPRNKNNNLIKKQRLPFCWNL